MIYLATLLHKKGNSPGLCKEGDFLLLLLSIGLDSHHIASWRFSLDFHHSAPWRLDSHGYLDSHHTVPWKLDAHGSLNSHHIALSRFSLDSHCVAPLEIGFSLLCQLCTMEWSSPCLSCWVRHQVSLLWQARPHTQHNGTRGETIPWHQGLGWQISTIFYWEKIWCSTDHIFVAPYYYWSSCMRVYHHRKIMLYFYCGQRKSDIICHPRP